MGLARVSSRITKKEDKDLVDMLEKRKTKIKVVGAGGAGNNTITRLMEVGIYGAETIAVNTDAQDLLYTHADKKILIGKELTRGLGAGSDPKLGMEAAKEQKDEIKQALKGADMVFITCGLGGGTGTGSAPVIAEVSKRLGALTVAVVTLPFSMEGRHRMENAFYGLDMLKPNVDTLIVIPNDKLLEVVPDVSLTTAFAIADEILVNAVKGITELITKPGLINLDFADVKAVMKQDGKFAMIGMGESDTENRAMESISRALNNPLLDVEIEGAKGALLNVTGGPSLTVKEAEQIAKVVRDKLDEKAKLIWGAMIDDKYGEYIKTFVVITGVKPRNFYEKYDVRKEKTKIETDLGIEFIE